MRSGRSATAWVSAMVLAVGFLLAGGSRLARAEDVQVSGLIFFDYAIQLGADDSGENTFEVRRVYINFKSDLGDGWSARATPDISYRGDTGPDNDFLHARLKYAYLKKKDIFSGSNLTIGLGSTPWIGYVDKIFDHRFATKSLTDRKFNTAGSTVLISADLGLTLDGRYRDGLLAYKVGVYNGEGYGNPDDGTIKSLQARVTFNKGVEVSLFLAQPLGQGSDKSGSRLGGLVGHAEEKWAALVSLMTVEDAAGLMEQGLGVYGRVKLNEKVDLFGRLYDIDPDTSTASDKRTEFMIGSAFSLGEKSRMAVSYEVISYEAGTEADQVLRLQFEIKF